MRVLTDKKRFQSKTFVFYKEMNAFMAGEAVGKATTVVRIIDSLPMILHSTQKDKLLREASVVNAIHPEMIQKGFRDRYKSAGNMFYRGRLTFSEVFGYILEHCYPAGIKLYSSQENMRFRKYVKTHFGDIQLPANDRSIHFRIAEISVLFDKGTFIHPTHIDIKKELLDVIFEHIRGSERKRFSYDELFETFKNDLMQSSNVTNRYFLQGVLRYFFKGDLFFTKDIVTKEKSAGLALKSSDFVWEMDDALKKGVKNPLSLADAVHSPTSRA